MKNNHGLFVPDEDLNFYPAYHRKTWAVCKEHIKDTRTAIDVGAHVGIFTRFLEELFDKVYAFEPEQENRRCFYKNVKSEIYPFPFALSSRRSHGSLHNPKPNNTGAWEFVEDRGGVSTTQTMTLDSFPFIDVDFIKIDTQGMENEVLIGASRILQENKPVLCVENSVEVRRRLEFLGYKVVREVEENLVAIP